MDEVYPPGWFVTGRFRIVAELARGGMGITYRAIDEAMGVPVVVKLPHRRLIAEPEFVARFQREARASAALSHPHIVPVVAHGTDDGMPYMAMRFLPGGSLADRLFRKPDNNPKPIHAHQLHMWLPAIASALDFAHGKAVLHRDVKPANIFFDGFGNAFLGDFGIAKVMEDSSDLDREVTLTSLNAALGTQYYMAPERFSPQAAVDGRSDQYSLAITVYESLAGRRPFTGASKHIVVEHTTVTPPPLASIRPDLSEEVCQAVHRGLSKNPADRFDSCSDFAAAVTRSIPAARQRRDSVQLLCPACKQLAKLPLSAGGKKGHCGRCKAMLSIAQDLGALWLRSEQSTIPDEPNLAILASQYSEVAPTPIDSTFSDRLELTSGPVIFSLITAATIFFGLFVMLSTSSTAPVVPLSAYQITAPTTPAPTTPAPKSPAPKSPASGVTPSVALTKRPQMTEPLLPATPMKPEITVASEADSVVSSPGVPPATESPLIADIAWVNIDDPGNHSDDNGLGAVAKTFRMSRYEVTNREYCRFLNASRAGRENLHGIGDRLARALPILDPADASCGIVLTRSTDGRMAFHVISGMEQMPVVNLRWCDAARFVNWLHNGGEAESETETGVYPLEGRDMGPADALPRDASAAVWIPSIDEWYKAAFFRRGGVEAGYWDFPLRTKYLPSPVSASKDGGGQGAPDGLSANFNAKAVWRGSLDQGMVRLPIALRETGVVTRVGTNGRPNAYGLFDMGGNVAELVTMTEPATGATITCVCGGDYRTRLVKALSAKAVPDSSRGVTGGLRLAARWLPHQREDQARQAQEPPPARWQP